MPFNNISKATQKGRQAVALKSIIIKNEFRKLQRKLDKLRIKENDNFNKLIENPN